MTRLDTLRERAEELRLEREVASLAAEVALTDQMSRLVVREDWGDRVDPTEPLTDTPGFFGAVGLKVSRPEDKRHGDNVPHWQTEQQWASIRGVCKYLGETDEVGISILENLANYTIKTGLTVTATATNSEWEPLACRVQHIVDRFLEFNSWAGRGERDAFIRSRRDGELSIALEHRGGINVEARLVDPSFITEPADKRRLEDYLGLPSYDWKYGIAKDWNNSARAHAYFVQWYGDHNAWDVYPPSHFVHLTLNVDREVARGCSDFYPVYKTLNSAEKLLGNTVEGSAIQAAIAYIREHATGTSNAAIQNLSTGAAEWSVERKTPTGSHTSNMRHARPGKVVDTKAGVKYHAGPLGQPRGQSYIEVVQAAYRRAGIRWTMPEYMVSGDASNANFSSTLVSESPFVLAGLARQQPYVQMTGEMLWKVLSILAEFGLLDGYSIAEVKRRVSLDIDPPELAVRNRTEEHAIRKDEHEYGLLSLDTWASEAGRDLDDERRKTRADAPDDGRVNPANAMPIAQLIGIADVLKNVSAGITPEVVAVELLVSAGIAPAKAKRMSHEASKVQLVMSPAAP